LNIIGAPYFKRAAKIVKKEQQLTSDLKNKD